MKTSYFCLLLSSLFWVACSTHPTPLVEFSFDKSYYLIAENHRQFHHPDHSRTIKLFSDGSYLRTEDLAFPHKLHTDDVILFKVSELKGSWVTGAGGNIFLSDEIVIDFACYTKYGEEIQDCEYGVEDLPFMKEEWFKDKVICHSDDDFIII